MSRILLLFFVLLLGQRAYGQFWDRETKLETGVLIGEIALDGFQTQHCQKIPGWCEEYNPIARPLVKRGNIGQGASCAMGLGAVLATSYLFHRFKHDRLSHWTLRVAVIVEGVNDGNNLR